MAGLCLGGLIWTGSQERVLRLGARKVHILSPGLRGGCLSSYVTHLQALLVTSCFISVSAHSKKSLLWVEGEAISFPIVHPIWASAPGTYPQGLSRDKSHETHCQELCNSTFGK